MSLSEQLAKSRKEIEAAGGEPLYIISYEDKDGVIKEMPISEYLKAAWFVNYDNKKYYETVLMRNNK